MAQSAYIYFVEGSEVSSMTLDDVKNQFLDYQSQTAKTGDQLDWDYADAAFPYTIEHQPGEEDRYFILKGKNPKYKNILIGVGQKKIEQTDADAEADKVRHYIQIVLPDNCTHGDKSKGNEYCKYIARRLKAELHLFNGRVMYFDPRK